MEPFSSERDVEIPISLPMLQWHIIDGTVDDEVSTATDEPDFKVVKSMGMSVREAGWVQVAHWTPEAPGSGSWPPSDEIVTVGLTRAQWNWVASVLEEWAEAVDDMRGGGDRARELREVVALVLSRLIR